MRIPAQVDLLEDHIHVLCFGNHQAGTDAVVVWCKTEKPADHRAVSTMASAGLGKRAVQPNHCTVRCVTQQGTRHQPQPRGTGRMRAGRAHHDWADHVEH